MQQQNDAMTMLVGNARGNSVLTDTRGICRPVENKGGRGQVRGVESEVDGLFRDLRTAV